MERDSFEQMVSGISNEERQRLLEQLGTVENQNTPPLHPVDDFFKDTNEPLEVELKRESLFLRFIIWLKAVLSSTTQKAIYNEYKLSEIARYVQKNFPGLINAKQSMLLSPFYEQLTELKAAADYFKPYLLSVDETDGSFYVFLSSFIMPEVTEEIKTNADPYSNPVTADIKPEVRTSLLRKLEDIFSNIPETERAKMYNAAKATEWLKYFIRLPFSRLITQFSSIEGKGYTCQFGQFESEIDVFAKLLCSSIDVPDEFLEALYMFAIRNARHFREEDTGRDAGEFLNKAHSNLGLLQMFMTSIPIRAITCLIHADSRYHIDVFSGGEDWFVKYKNTLKKIFEQKWAAWESDCKKQALLSTLKINFSLESFPVFPERPWEELWNGIPFAYDSTLGFLNWFMRESFPSFEMHLKTLLTQGSFNKNENYNMLSDAFNAMIQLSISFQELERKLSPHGEIGGIFYKIKEDISRTLQAQSKVEQKMREVESDVKSLIHRFGDNSRIIDQVLSGILGYSKDARFDTVSNLNKMRDKNNEPFVKRLETSRLLLENAINLVMELEQLDQQKVG